MGRRVLVLMVATAGCIEATAQGVIALLADQRSAALVWSVATITIIVVAVNIETVKAFLEE